MVLKKIQLPYISLIKMNNSFISSDSQEKTLELSLHPHTEKPWEPTARRQSSTNQRAGPHQTLNLPIPWSWTCGLWNCEINVRCSSCTGRWNFVMVTGQTHTPPPPISHFLPHLIKLRPTHPLTWAPNFASHTPFSICPTFSPFLLIY